MAVGQVGPFTAVVESLATAIGAGMVLGGFAIGTAGFLAGRSRQELAERALTDGYAGGLIGIASVLFDLVLRYVL
jgi:hypothetical protein